MHYIKSSWKLAVFVFLIAGISLTGAGFYQNISAKDDNTPYRELEVFSDVLSLIENNYVEDVDPKELVENAIEGMVNGLDPHSAYLPPEAFEELQVETKGEFGGIGIVITKAEGRLTVVSPIEGTPAYKAGIETGDSIIAVDEESTKDMVLWEAVKLMRGPVGEPVKITVYRKGEKEPLVFDLIRDVIPMKSVKYAELKPGYAIIFINSFKEKTLDELEEAISILTKKRPLNGLVIDLRSNPGGLLDQAVDVSDYFLESGTIVSVKGRKDSNAKEYKAGRDGTEGNFPIVVLINGGSASASEIVAGALQDHKRAIVLGTSSFGKGSVQTVRPLKNGCALKYTIARYYTPSGRSIQAEGIKPDIELKYIRPSENEDKEKKNLKFLKEKDLENHLEAELVAKKVKKPEEDKDKNKEELIHSKEVEMDKVEKDNQIQHALNLLVSYYLFNR